MVRVKTTTRTLKSVDRVWLNAEIGKRLRAALLRDPETATPTTSND